MIKQWIIGLLLSGTDPLSIVYLTGEFIGDHHSLVALVNALLSDGDGLRLRYLCINEVTYIREWDRGIKYLADAGQLSKIVLVLTGSDLVLIREARARLSGGRDSSAVCDFHLFPLSFHDFVRLTKVLPVSTCDAIISGATPVPKTRGVVFCHIGTQGRWKKNYTTGKKREVDKEGRQTCLDYLKLKE